MEFARMSVYRVYLVRFRQSSGEIRWGIQNDGVTRVLPSTFSLNTWLIESCGKPQEAVASLVGQAEAEVSGFTLLAPVETQEVWAAGVTYERSREARQEESVDGGDIYARVYGAERPEIFFKSQGHKVVAHLNEVGIRSDATWSVPEPELAVVFNPAMEAVGFTIGNDMSSRDIEGANPLYLPQAKVYALSCSMGPSILLQPADAWLDTTIRVSIERGGEQVFSGDVSTARIKRKLTELAMYLGRSNEFPEGVILLTGTGVVPGGDFTLSAGDVVSITIDGIGTLTNTVKVV
jgi:2-dehydro-3-deoxy-D-arabinonate dehydratase